MSFEKITLSVMIRTKHVEYCHIYIYKIICILFHDSVVRKENHKSENRLALLTCRNTKWCNNHSAYKNWFWVDVEMK